MKNHETLDEIKAECEELTHAMQSGVAMMMNFDPAETNPKHLRVGVNSALVNCGALAGLLIDKFIITEREYYTALRDKMQEEVESYKKLLSARLNGAEVNLR